MALEASCGKPPQQHSFKRTWSLLLTLSKWGSDPIILGNDPIILGSDPIILGNDPIMLGSDPNILGNDPIILGNVPIILGNDQPFLGGHGDVQKPACQEVNPNRTLTVDRKLTNTVEVPSPD